MKKNYLSLLILLFYVSSVLAIRTRSKPTLFLQPDGQKLTVILKGDEFFHFRTTVDGFVLLKDKNGFLKYAKRDKNGELVASEITPNNVSCRTESEKSFLSSVKPNMIFGDQVKQRTQKKMIERAVIRPHNSLRSATATSPRYLVVLVNFSDTACFFSNSRFNQQFNSANYNIDGATGSVKQYFADNSSGKFDPVFDVVGPVTLSKKMSYYGANNADGYDLHPDEMVFEACQLLDSQVDYSLYDANSDGVVDNVYVIYAGYSEAEGASENTIWPHAWSVSNTTKLDGKRIGNYSCSSEFVGVKDSIIDAIGTACHEFSHSLGLDDLYDTDYDTNGQAFDVNEWSLMASGCYNNDGKTPCNLIGLEREILGWATSTPLTSASNVTLNNISTNQFYKIQTQTPNEYFLLENRQLLGWDAYLPHHGMLIYHIDKTTAMSTRWANNEINAYANHQCVDVVEADGVGQPLSSGASSYWSGLKGDPFPGTSNVTNFTDTSSPGSLSWAGVATGMPVTQIAENGGVISFKFKGGDLFGAFTASPASSIISNAFTANWSASTNAQKYLLNVFSKKIFPTTLTTTSFGFSGYPYVVPDNWVFSFTDIYGTTSNYGVASPSLKFASDKTTFTTEIFPDVLSKISFWIKGQSTDALSALQIEASKDKTTWTTVATLSTLPTTGKNKELLLDVSKGYKVLRFTYLKSVGNLSFDDLTVTYGGNHELYFLKNQVVNSALNYRVTGLDNNGKYFYNVRAVNQSDTSAVSNTIEVQLASPTGATNHSDDSVLRFTSSGEKITIELRKAEEMVLYDFSGRVIRSENLPAGTHTLSLSGHNIYIIKIGSVVRKFILY